MTSSPAPTVTQAGTWQLDPVHSRVGFSVEYLAGTFHGSFASFDASLEIDDAGMHAIAGQARVDSVQVPDESLGAHLLSPEFFDAERAPEISFRSEAFAPSGTEVVLQGELSIKGITKPVELTGTAGGPIVDAYGRERLNLQLETTVDRSQFGLDWNAPLPNGQPALGNDVTLTAELAFVKA